MKIKLTFLCMATVVLLLFSSALFTSCEQYTFTVDSGNTPDTTTVYFQAQIQPIFNDPCINCHHGSNSPDLRDGKSYESLTAGGYITPPAESSRLYEQVTSQSHTSYTSTEEKNLIFNWINQGAPNN